VQKYRRRPQIRCALRVISQLRSADVFFFLTCFY
jgi:hypothetical protein